MARLIPCGLVLCVILGISGCAAGKGLVLRTPQEGRSDKVRYWVFGFGVITVETPKAPAATVVQTKTLGIQLGGAPAPRLTMGYSFLHATMVPAEAEIVLEVESKPFGHPVVTVISDPKPSFFHAHQTPPKKPAGD